MLGFGTLTALTATVTWANSIGTVEFELPDNQQLLVMGIRASPKASSTGDSTIVTSISHRKDQRILGADVGTSQATNYIEGVPLSHIAAIGDAPLPLWPGYERYLVEMINASFATSPPSLASGLKNARDLAWQSIKRLQNGNTDLAGFIVSGNKLTIKMQDIAASTDEIDYMTLICVVLGQSEQTSMSNRMIGTPYWYKTNTVALSTTAATVDAQETAELPAIEGEDKGAYFLQIGAIGSVFVDSTRVPSATEAGKVLAGNVVPNGQLGQFIGARAALDAYAIGSNAIPLIFRKINNNNVLRWEFSTAGLAAASRIYLTNYLLPVK